MKSNVVLFAALLTFFVLVVMTKFGSEPPTPVILVIASEHSFAEEPLFVDEITDGRSIPPTEDDRQLVIDLLAENFYGEVLDAGEWHFVDIVNPEPVMQQFSNGSFPLSFGEPCGIGRAEDEEGGTIQVRGEAPDGRVLYEYTTLGSPLGTSCPCGILFFGPRMR
ncbi:MAG: hypothetical protein HY369_01500 [Candidatus Aenigmarchaeota archaeon]|nr:hypothetical protein [Candidatus Aenigmarchaeota archaeon]